MAVFDLPNGEKLNVPDQYLGDVDMASNIKDVYGIDINEVAYDLDWLADKPKSIARGAVGLAADVKSAYHTIEVDVTSSFLRLFFWWNDLPTCKQARIFRQVTQSFGDTSAAIGLEIGIIKFVAAIAVMAVTKFLLEFSRYADTFYIALKQKKNS